MHSRGYLVQEFQEIREIKTSVSNGFNESNQILVSIVNVHDNNKNHANISI